MNKAASTVQAYLKRGNQLWLRAAKECGLSPMIMSPSDFIHWLENQLPTLKPASRRQYIASVKQHLLMMRDNVDVYLVASDALEWAFQQSQQMRSADYVSLKKGIKPWRGKTSSQKSKHLHVTDLSELVKQTTDMRGKWIKPALLWMAANMVVGLRPGEWRSAYVSQQAEKKILIVQNAKNTNGRAHGVLRHIDITGLKAEEFKLVISQCDAAKQHSTNDDAWNTYYRGVRKTIHRITRAILPNQRKYPTLYTSRHQFAADAKSAGMSKIEIAALMGHAIDETSTTHYGKRKHGRGKCRVRADAAEMATIRVKADVIKNKRQQYIKV